MTSEENKILIETEQRSKSNTHQIEEIKEKLKLHDEEFKKNTKYDVDIATLAVILEEMRADNKEQSIINKEITGALVEIKDSILQTNGKIEKIASAQESISKNQECMNIKIAELDGEIKSVDNKGKITIDIVQTIKTLIIKHWYKVFFILGGAAGIVTLLKEYVHFTFTF